MKYILDSTKTAIPVSDEVFYKAWIAAVLDGSWVVGCDFVGPYWISTIFDGGTDKERTPTTVFEIVIFNGAHVVQTNYAETWDEAMQMHAKAVAAYSDTPTPGIHNHGKRIGAERNEK